MATGKPAPKDASVGPKLLSPEGRERMIIKHRAKAQKIARSLLRRWNSRLDLDEIDSIVDLSLCEAASRFSPEVGASFITFLFYHLRGNLIRTISVAANQNTVPLFDSDACIGDDSDGIINASASDIADALSGSDAMRPDEVALKRELYELSMKAKDKLDALAKEVLDRVYGDEEQLIDVANSLGYSRCHISRVKRRALETLYDDLSVSLALDANDRPDFDEDDRKVSKKVMKGKKQPIHRRKPRSAIAAQDAIRRAVNG